MGGAERPPSALSGPSFLAYRLDAHNMKNPLLSFALATLIIVSSLGGDVQASFSLSSVMKQAEVIKVTAVSAISESGITVKTMVRGFAANDPYAIKQLTVPKNTFLNGVKSGFGGGISNLAKSNAWYAAFFLTVGAAGWAIDELRNQVVNTVPPVIPNYFPAAQVFDGCTIVDPVAGSIFVYGNITMSGCLQNRISGGSWTDMSVAGGFTYNGTYWQAPLNMKFNGNPRNPSFVRVYTNIAPLPSPSTVEPVNDDSLYNSLIAAMLNDPIGSSNAFQSTGAEPVVYPDLFPPSIPYLPNVSPEDEVLLDQYQRGLLQSTDPNAPYYVTPEKYAQIEALAGQLSQSITPEGQVDAANQALKNPLTQPQLEESLKKKEKEDEEATKAALGDLPVLSTLLDPYKQFEEGVKATPNDQINNLPSNTYFISGSGTCYQFNRSFSIMGQSVTLSTRDFCDAYYYPYFLPILTWFFYMATGIYVWFSLRDAYSRRV